MTRQSTLAALATRQWTPRSVLWAGALIIAGILATAVFDIVTSHRAAVADAGRQLETQARIVAEQTARSVQAVDVVLRHLVQQARRSTFDAMGQRDLHNYLSEQAVGLVQTEGLLIVDANGWPRAASVTYPLPQPLPHLSGRPIFDKARSQREAGLIIDVATRSDVDGLWIFPMVRRLETAAGDFAGLVGARGRIDYYQKFYSDIQLEAGSAIVLMHRNGTLLARHPAAESALGKHIPLFEDRLKEASAGTPGPSRHVSPVDGVERFSALRAVQDYPLVVLVTRDAAAALAPWRAQAIGTAVRSLAFSALALLLLWLLVRQLSHLQETRRSFEISQERYALAVAGSDDGIWDFDFSGRRVFNSARARELAGLPPGPDMLPMDQWFAEIPIHPEDAPRRLADMEAHLAGRTPAYMGEYRMLQSDGSHRWVRIRGLCIRDATGKPLRMAGSISDVDARRRAEDALRESQERFALAVAGSNDGIVDWDLVNDRMYTSERALQIVGIDSTVTLRPRAEWTQLIEYHPDDQPRMRRELDDFLAGRVETRDGVYRIRLPDGTYRWVRHRNMCVRDANGRPLRVAGSLSDVDAQMRAEAALRESEERYQLAVDGASQGLWDWDLKNDMLYLSARAQMLNFIEPGEPLRPRKEWVRRTVYHPDDIARVRRAISAHLRGATPEFSIEYRVRHHSGTWHWYRQRGVALRDAQGRAYRMAGSMEDITEYKEAEARRASLEGELLQAKKLEAIGTLAGGIAHDFNNILSAILGYGEMAQKGASEGSALRRHIDAVVNAGMRAKSLVERILAFSRSGIGERMPVHVQSVVEETLDLVAASLPGHVRLERRLSAGDAAIMGDPTQIHQVLMNLCANAAQAMKTAGTLTVSLAVVDKGDSMAATSALAGGRYVRVDVRDTGTGIPPGVLERIFDPFFTTKEIGVGTGLGLSLVHGIVTDLGGGIDVDSRDGAGSTFTVYLPWHDTRAAPVGTDPGVPGGAGETILLVDDEEALVTLGEELIAMLGYEPVGFTSGSAALQAFRAAPERFHVVLSDESMPEMTGSDLARQIRAIRPATPIVLMTGHVSAALSARANEIGVTEILAKPLVSRDIARSLAAALRA